MCEVFINFTRVNWTTFANEVEQQFRLLLLPGRERRPGIRTRVHQRLQSTRDITVVHKEIFFNIELRITTLEIARVIILHTMSQYQILRACRRPNRIGLYKPHLLKGAIKCGWLGKIPRDGIPPQVIERDRQVMFSRSDDSTRLGILKIAE